MGNLIKKGLIPGGGSPGALDTDDITNDSNVTGVTVTDAFNTLEDKGHVSDVGWIDLLQSFENAKGNGTSEPVWKDVGNGQYAYHFTSNDELFVSYHVPHSYKRGTDAYPHIHFLVDQTMTAGQVITWEFGYVIAKSHNQGQSLTGAEAVMTIVYTATGTEVAGEHLLLECDLADGFDLIEPDTIIKARVTLANENVAGNVFGLMADLHMQVDRLSTPSRNPDFYT